MRVTYVIIFVSDMKRSIAFYRDVLGMDLKFETSHWTEFMSEGVTVTLHVDDEHVVPLTGQKKLVAGQCRPGVSVPDLDSFHRKMSKLNVVCVQEPQESFGASIAQYADPDGLAISVSEVRA